MSAETEGGQATSLDHSEDRIIPYTIYLLSFVLNVGGQYTDQGSPARLDRKELQTALGLHDQVAQNIEDRVGVLGAAHFKQLAQPFAEAIGYGHVGCPAKIDTLLVLAKKWMATTVQQ